MIVVKYTTGLYDLVSEESLDQLLSKEKVAKFKRSTGWAVVGVDMIRGAGSPAYGGVERREHRAARLY